jgi:hypothetical protein
MNMLAQHHRESPQQAPVETLPMLDFGAKRAGRAVADLQGLKFTALGACAQTIYRGQALWQRVLAGYVKVQHRTWADSEHAVLLIRGATTEMEPVSTVEDDDVEADLVQWFIEGQSEAEESLQAESLAAHNDPEQSGEPIRALRVGLRSQSWRGGGTMHRR